MSLHRLPVGALVVTADDLGVLRYAVTVCQRARRRNTLPPLAALERLAAACNVVTARGQSDAEPEPVGDDELMTTETAARVLGCSPRQARRLAPLLGGRRVGGRWFLDAHAVTEHREGRSA